MTCENNDGPCNECELELCPDQIEGAERKHAKLKAAAFERLSDAEKAMYKYFCNCELGEERILASQIYENIRVAARIG